VWGLGQLGREEVEGGERTRGQNGSATGVRRGGRVASRAHGFACAQWSLQRAEGAAGVGVCARGLILVSSPRPDAGGIERRRSWPARGASEQREEGTAQGGGDPGGSGRPGDGTCGARLGAGAGASPAASAGAAGAGRRVAHAG
jgi:hypothetical protein